ncbi:hypothetical protein EOD39_7288 [Acipenser ruthenus]|uniref:ERC protein 2 n=1 Tax=Acipenser ruthenus TaxID=7906 RepID=A0A444U7E6_ACIRT|nr:hypothetical protein EOD39_7288 [Acipenser ruthenus]
MAWQQPTCSARVTCERLSAMGSRRQEALLAAISEKDANIALLELSSSKKKKTQDEVTSLKREKDRLVQQLKQQTQNRMKLMADNYEDDHLKSSQHSDQTNHKPSPDQDTGKQASPLFQGPICISDASSP